MATSLGQVLAQIQRWVSPRLEEFSDAQLLQRFIQDREESAFAALVARHGAMVLRSCRRILGDGHEVEDAFQATFLILARKAQSLRQPDALPGYLHSIARRVALRARARSAVRARQAPLPADLPDPRGDPLARLTARELLRVLDEEVARLPRTQRSAVVLCCLEGRTQEEAARLLGWTAGSLRGHLERGRHRLQARLLRRGITLPAALAVVAVSRGEAASAPLFQNTVKAALHGGIGSTPSALAHSVLKTMLLGKIAGVLAVTLTVALAASTTVAVFYRGSATEPPEDKKPAAPAAPRESDASKPKVRTDALGDPLPDGALRRLGTLRFRHGGAIETLLLTPDGKTLVSNDHYGTRTVCVWEMATGKLRHRLPGTHEEKKIALSPDGKLVAVGQDKAIVLWDLISGKKVRRLAQANTTGCAFSPDGKILAAAGYDPQDIHVWNPTTGKKIAQFEWKRHTTSVVLLAFTPDGKTLIAGQKFDSKIGLWDMATGKKRGELDAESGHVLSFALSPDGATLATGGRQGGIRLWDVKTGKLVHKLRTEAGKACTSVAFSPSGKTLAAVETDYRGHNCLSLWDVVAGEELRRIKGDDGFENVLFSRDGKTLIAASIGAIRLLDVATGKEVGPTAGSPGYVGFATMSPDGRTLAYFRQNEVRFWDMRAGREIGSINVPPDGLSALALSPDGRTAVVSGGEHDIKLWDVKDRKLLLQLPWDKKDNPYDWWSRAIAFSPEGRLLASGYYGSGIVRIWETVSGKQVLRLQFNDDEKAFSTVEAVVFSPDGKTLAVSGRGNGDSSKVRLRDVATGKPLTHLNVHLNDPADAGPPGPQQHPRGPIVEPKILFSPNGWMMAMNRWQNTVPVWEAITGRQRLLLKGHEGSTVCVAFAPDSRTLASASWDNTIRLWDLQTGRELRKMTGHRGKANSLAFSADGKVLVSAGDDTTILFWDVAGVTHRKRSLAASFSEREWQALWEDLASDDAATAYAAMVRMTADGPSTIAALKARLHPIRPVNPDRLSRLLKELDSDEFAVRESASRELEKLGDVVGPTIRQTLARPGLSLELRRRLEAIAASLEELSGARLRQVRAIEVLEMLGTPQACELVKTIAEGASGARLTEQAKPALQLLKR